MVRSMIVGSLVTLILGCATTRPQHHQSVRPYVVSELTEEPRLKNPADIRCEVLSLRPLALRYAGSGGSAVLDITLDAGGRVERVRLYRSSGFPSLDQVALRIACAMRFSPGRIGRFAVAPRFTLPLELDIARVRVSLPPSRFEAGSGCG